MFIDASALVAMLAEEPEAEFLAVKVDGARVRLISAIAKFEAVLAIARIKRLQKLEDAIFEVEKFCDAANVSEVHIDQAIGAAALAAHSEFGKGRHAARLNMGDCFAYACAKVHKVPLLCTGDDFSQTDITIA